ncbi:hypothetical protein SAMN04488542_12092 [Fontibacillus panacisegetis]|uniref:Uncharacterized protein n=1 Tax=Fontibacillus panacisegetis TaxID=670482 RepID=A0A1G7Q3N1_9BACL|nr:hypothetical protein [Fontibacillus panacisegetis]SDF92549.1 hypothetical protein SAMN04488542_12092 [Fontibacillus panacisegetis]
MGFIDKFFKKQKTEAQPQDNERIQAIQHAINIMENADSESTEEIIENINQFTKDKHIARELYCLIPSSYCRLIIREVTYSNELITMSPDGSQKMDLISNHQLYNLIQDVLIHKFNGEIDNDKIQTILFQSAEFNAINNALNNGSALEDLMTGPLVILASDNL